MDEYTNKKEIEDANVNKNKKKAEAEKAATKAHEALQAKGKAELDNRKANKDLEDANANLEAKKAEEIEASKALEKAKVNRAIAVTNDNAAKKFLNDSIDNEKEALRILEELKAKKAAMEENNETLVEKENAPVEEEVKAETEVTSEDVVAVNTPATGSVIYGQVLALIISLIGMTASVKIKK